MKTHAHTRLAPQMALHARTARELMTANPLSISRAATVRDNVVNGCLSGITLSTTLGVEMTGNQVTGCVGEGLHARGQDVRIERNAIERCGSGMVADARARATIVGNTVAHCSGPGMTVAVTQDGTVTGNVVWGNAGDGLDLCARLKPGLHGRS